MYLGIPAENRRNPESTKLVLGWVAFAVSALIVAGGFAFLTAMARTPGVQGLFSGNDYVRVALVGHVVLSFVIWFIAFEGALWTFASTAFLREPPGAAGASWAGLIFSVLGTVLIVAASLLGLGKPLFINYVPVLDHPVFYTGLVALGTGVLITLVACARTAQKVWRSGGYRVEESPGEPKVLGRLVRLAVVFSGVSALVALVCFGLSFYFIMAARGEVLFSDLETLFWGGGHILQFTNTIAMAAVWLYLAGVVFKGFSINESAGKTALYIFLAFVLYAPFAYLFHDIDSYGYRESFTRLMQYGLGPSVLYIAAVITVSGVRLSGVRKLPWGRPEFSALLMSFMLFAMGGIISSTIHGYNTKIPSHYHGAIGAVTMAFMGMTYHLLGLLGRRLYSKRLASIQPWLYGVGQALFVAGMFWAGSHGVARKTFGAEQHLDDPVKIISMVVFGLGGLVAIAGGILFIINAGASLFGRSPRAGKLAEEAECGTELEGTSPSSR